MLTEASRSLPTEFYNQLREGLLGSFVETILEGKPGVHLVVDSNIIVIDAFRVAGGRPSSTERLLASPFLKLVAPREIVLEVSRNIDRDAGPRIDKRLAQEHADRLLKKIELVDEVSPSALRLAAEVLPPGSGSDVVFLGLAIEANAHGLISKNWKDFDKQDKVARWEMNRTASCVATFESGTLSLMILGKGSEAALKGAETIALILLDALAEALAMAVKIVSVVVSKGLEGLSKLPEWAWAAIGIGSIAILIAAILHDGFRSWLAEGASKAGNFLAQAAEAAMELGRTIWSALKEILLALWEWLRPIAAAGVVLAGVLLRRVLKLLEEGEQLARSNAS